MGSSEHGNGRPGCIKGWGFPVELQGKSAYQGGLYSKQMVSYTVIYYIA